MVGASGSGKSHVVRKHIAKAGYISIRRDVLGTWQMCLMKLKELLPQKKSFVVDCPNVDIATRRNFIEFAKENNLPIRCFVMTTNLTRCYHNSVVCITYNMPMMSNTYTICLY